MHARDAAGSAQAGGPDIAQLARGGRLAGGVGNSDNVSNRASGVHRAWRGRGAARWRSCFGERHRHRVRDGVNHGHRASGVERAVASGVHQIIWRPGGRVGDAGTHGGGHYTAGLVGEHIARLQGDRRGRVEAVGRRWRDRRAASVLEFARDIAGRAQTCWPGIAELARSRWLAGDVGHGDHIVNRAAGIDRAARRCCAAHWRSCLGERHRHGVRDLVAHIGRARRVGAIAGGVDSIRRRPSRRVGVDGANSRCRSHQARGLVGEHISGLQRYRIKAAHGLRCYRRSSIALHARDAAGSTQTGGPDIAQLARGRWFARGVGNSDNVSNRASGIHRAWRGRGAAHWRSCFGERHRHRVRHCIGDRVGASASYCCRLVGATGMRQVIRRPGRRVGDGGASCARYNAVGGVGELIAWLQGDRGSGQAWRHVGSARRVAQGAKLIACGAQACCRPCVAELARGSARAAVCNADRISQAVVLVDLGSFCWQHRFAQSHRHLGQQSHIRRCIARQGRHSAAVPAHGAGGAAASDRCCIGHRGLRRIGRYGADDACHGEHQLGAACDSEAAGQADKIAAGIDLVIGGSRASGCSAQYSTAPLAARQWAGQRVAQHHVVVGTCTVVAHRQLVGDRIASQEGAGRDCCFADAQVRTRGGQAGTGAAVVYPIAVFAQAGAGRWRIQLDGIGNDGRQPAGLGLGGEHQHDLAVGRDGR